MRVVIVNKFARVTGGADRHCLELGRALRGAGHEVAFLTTVASGNQAVAGAFVPCSVTADNRSSLGLRRAQRAARRGVWNATAAAAIEQLLERFRPDVVHLHKLYPQLSVAPAVVAARRGVSVVQTLHDYELLAGQPLQDGTLRPVAARPWSERLLSATLRVVHRLRHRPAVSGWVAGSRYVARSYARVGIEASVIPLPVMAPSGEVPSFRARRGVVFAGRLAPEKGVFDVVELARGAPLLEVKILGGGPLEPVLRDQAHNLPNLEVLGPVPEAEVWRSLRQARLLVAPSRWAEPVGLAALEAMAVGTPVVAYAVGGLAEQVREACGGSVIPPDPSALVKACLALNHNEERWQTLAGAGRAHVTREHDPARYVDRLLDVYATTGAIG